MNYAQFGILLSRKLVLPFELQETVGKPIAPTVIGQVLTVVFNVVDCNLWHISYPSLIIEIQTSFTC